VTVSASDGKVATSQAIAILVTDVANESVAAGRRAANQVWAKVVWSDVRGQMVFVGEQWLDPDAPRPVVPAGVRGLAIAEIMITGMPIRTVRMVVPGPK